MAGRHRQRSQFLFPTFYICDLINKIRGPLSTPDIVGTGSLASIAGRAHVLSFDYRYHPAMYALMYYNIFDDGICKIRDKLSPLMRIIVRRELEDVISPVPYTNRDLGGRQPACERDSLPLYPIAKSSEAKGKKGSQD